MRRSFELKPRSTAKVESIPSFFRAAPAPGRATSSPANRSTLPPVPSVSDTAAARTPPTSTTSSNRRIPKSRAWTVPSSLSCSFSTAWLRRADRARCEKSAASPGESCFRSVEMEIAIVLTQPHRGAKQVRKMFRCEHGRSWPIRCHTPFSQEYDALHLRDNFRDMVCYQQDSEPGSRKLTHRVSKLQLCRDVQRVARLVEKQRLWLMH